tara:strand:- start:2005 stop:4242 length:2238 start_codon:yes stop_codon:yes gene_type:complete
MSVDLYNKTFQGYATADDVNTEASTLRKDDIYVTNISDPNVLHDFASYNAIFTLSALGQRELENTTTLLNSKPHDIIIRSSGIGPTETNVFDEVGLAGGISEEDQKILDQNERLRGAVNKSQRVLSRNRDLYFKSVTATSIPGLNEQRRLTSVTTIEMEIVEPAGVTLLERIRGAAINNGYLDHLDAPYLLTIEFKGFDELGQVASDKQAKVMKRLIPVKLIDMQLDVNQAGTVYAVKAIPYNEFAFVNTYNYTRTSGSLFPVGKKLKDVVVALEEVLNKQTQDEKDQGLVELADTYQIAIHPDLKPEQETTITTIDQTGMFSQAVDTGDVPVEYMKISSGFAITKILEEIMKGHPDFSDKKFKEFKQKCATKLSGAQRQGGAQGVLKATQAKEFYFKYFKIRASVVPQDGEFDTIRATNRKIITYTVEPYEVHAYSLAIPGVSTGQNFKSFVFKTYNYIFTGENIDILDLNIHYRVAYFQSRLKDFEATDKKKNKIENVSVTRTGNTTAKDIYGDGNLVNKSEVGVAKSEGTGKTGGTPKELDVFLDSLTHPLADMVNIRLEILGDPAWISQSQFIPLNAKNFTIGRGIFEDTDIDYWRANRGRIWNDQLRCYNTDVAEPIILLNFRMPTDLDDKRGVYELQSNQSAEFSGLYRVISVEHNFTDGRYTNVLNLTRFNNQGVIISDPVPTSNVTSKDGGETQILSSNEAYRLYISKNPFAKQFDNLTSIGKKFVDLASKIKGFLS